MAWTTNTSILAQLETFSAQTAWSSLVDHFERPLSRFAQRSGLPRSSIADVVQGTLITFAEGYRKGKYDRARGRLSDWLYGIHKREIAAARRKFATHREEGQASEVLRDRPSGEGDLDEIWEEEWRRAILERSLEWIRKEIEPATWECFALQTFEGLGSNEVAAHLGMPVSRVYNAKHRVVKRLRELAREFEDV